MPASNFGCDQSQYHRSPFSLCRTGRESIGEFNDYCWKDLNLVSSHRKTLTQHEGSWIFQGNHWLDSVETIYIPMPMPTKTQSLQDVPPFVSPNLRVLLLPPSIQSQNVMLDLPHRPRLSEFDAAVWVC